MVFLGYDGKVHTSYCWGFGRTDSSGRGQSGSCTSGNWTTYTTPTSNECLGPAGGSIALTARAAENLDAFWVANSGAACTSYWTPSAFWPSSPVTAGNLVPAGGKIAAVARAPFNLDVFFVGKNAQGTSDIYSAWWYPQQGGWGWADVQGVYGGNAIAGATLGVTARTPEILDVFTMGFSLFGGGTVSQSTAYWSPSTNGWHGYRTDGY